MSVDMANFKNIGLINFILWSYTMKKMMTLLLAATAIGISSPVLAMEGQRDSEECAKCALSRALAGGDDYKHGELEQAGDSNKTVGTMLRAIDAAFSYKDKQAGQPRRRAFILNETDIYEAKWIEQFKNPVDFPEYPHLKVKVGPVYVDETERLARFYATVVNARYEGTAEITLPFYNLTDRGKEIFRILQQEAATYEIVNPGYTFDESTGEKFLGAGA